jgi:orotidine-5'-phosphate decarboxylase
VQGADVERAVRAGVDERRGRALVVSGRAILAAPGGAAGAARALHDAIEAARRTASVA